MCWFSYWWIMSDVSSPHWSTCWWCVTAWLSWPDDMAILTLGQHFVFDNVAVCDWLTIVDFWLIDRILSEQLGWSQRCQKTTNSHSDVLVLIIAIWHSLYHNTRYLLFRVDNFAPQSVLTCLCFIDISCLKSVNDKSFLADISSLRVMISLT